MVWTHGRSYPGFGYNLERYTKGRGEEYGKCHLPRKDCILLLGSQREQQTT
jgi:hypothetical protein